MLQVDLGVRDLDALDPCQPPGAWGEQRERAGLVVTCPESEPGGRVSPDGIGLAVEGLDGQQVADIAAALYISPHTVRDHLKAIYRKTRSHTRHQLSVRPSGYGPAD